MHEAATPSPPSSPRDTRSRRHRILGAAQELFAEIGFDAAPMFRAAFDPEHVEPVRAFDVLSSLLDTGLPRASDRGRSKDS